jgi:hypothetical protein
VAVGRTYLLPPLSSGGASLVRPWLRFHTPLIEPDMGFSASGSRTRLHAFPRVTPSAVSERFSELLGCPISRSLTASCVGLELRPLPSTGITRLQRYYEPLRLLRLLPAGANRGVGLAPTGKRRLVTAHVGKPTFAEAIG